MAAGGHRADNDIRNLHIGRDQLRSLGPVVAFDLVAPLAVYSVVCRVGVAAVTALIVSGFPPAARIIAGMARHRRLDVIGAFVLAGIAVGSVAGGVSNSTHLILLDGVVPTLAFGAVCLVSLGRAKPIIFRFAMEILGVATEAGRLLARRWSEHRIRRAFKVMTVVWAAAYFAEAASQLAVIQMTSVSTAKLTSILMPAAVTVGAAAWNVVYARRHLHRWDDTVAG